MATKEGDQATKEGDLATESPGTVSETPGTVSETAGTVGKHGDSVLGDSVAKAKLPPLFDAGYCDVMPVDEAQLATQRAYNPPSTLVYLSLYQWSRSHRDHPQHPAPLRDAPSDI